MKSERSARRCFCWKWLQFLCLLCMVQAALRADDEPSTEMPVELPPAAQRPVDFVRDIEPILAARCYDCHGAETHDGQLRLDAHKIVLHGGVSGPAIVPGHSEQSLLVRRLVGLRGEERMPLDEEPLSVEQIGLIRAWIDQGAVWPKGVGADIDSLITHWAYDRPVRPLIPSVTQHAWIRNPIDAFVLARLESDGLLPTKEADRARLMRRVYLDLIGLPPTPDEVDLFLADRKPGAYERMVDGLLASPRYGERWARPWLDAARFADSNGYQRDDRREVWAYRDWVIRALNDDLPFDEFTIAQIAGDLLPDATLDQKIATGFHRGTMANVEAGTDPEEERVQANIDRVNTTATVWLGTTLECAQCHNHKYDPFSQRDYYRLYAFFNSTAEEIETNGSNREFTGPKMELPLPPELQARRATLESQSQTLETSMQQLTRQLSSEMSAWEESMSAAMTEPNWQTLTISKAGSRGGATLTTLDDGSVLVGGDLPGTDVYEVTAQTEQTRITAIRLEILTDPSLPAGGPGRVEPGNFILSEFQIQATIAVAPDEWTPLEIGSTTADYAQPNWPIAAAVDGNRKTGWAVGKQFGQPHHAVFVLSSPMETAGGTLLRFVLDQQFGRDRTIGRFRLSATSVNPAALGMPAEIQEILQLAVEQRSDKQQQTLKDFYLEHSQELRACREELAEVKSQLDELQPATTLVMQELAEPRMTNVFVRGNFLNTGEPVQAGTPRMLHPFPTVENVDRLGLARWLVAEENPLVARVTVNRHWARFFGQGIVSTLEDFGTQGERPSHPELLDWLATEFTRTGWSLKSLHRLIVTSATYRQSSHVTPELLQRDPYNKLYARGPRFRLEAELIRDNVLAVSGLLSDKMHGPPVFPHQPAGVWNHIGRTSNDWTTSTGEDLHRRGVYVYWRRTVPYPSFVNFDACSREASVVERSRSNTPLQALTLLNDPAYFEAAVALAGRMWREPGRDASMSDRINWGFRLSTGRMPKPRELEILLGRFEQERERYLAVPKKARQILAHGPSFGGVAGVDSGHPADQAALVHVANILLNLDEVITKG